MGFAEVSLLYKLVAATVIKVCCFTDISSIMCIQPFCGADEAWN